MHYHLLCIHPFHGYLKGQIIEDQAEVKRLLAERDVHFAKYVMPGPQSDDPEPEEAALSAMPAPSY